ncbi:MAG: hypothetical protein LUI14_00410, partial [Lachnospiraceae bacterium]|nr:hypothetical protein [Lachnospiraceae bacterium]
PDVGSRAVDDGRTETPEKLRIIFTHGNKQKCSRKAAFSVRRQRLIAASCLINDLTMLKYMKMKSKSAILINTTQHTDSILIKS